MLGLCEALTIISIHALLAESDPGSLTQLLERKYFYPRSPCGERPLDRCNGQGPDDFYPRSPCGERPKAQDEYKDTVTISIHALLAESDDTILQYTGAPTISIHALLAESDTYPSQCRTLARDFYPRSPCGERRDPAAQLRCYGYFYPRSPCGERPRSCPASSPRRYFYPRSPCGERR